MQFHKIPFYKIRRPKSKSLNFRKQWAKKDSSYSFKAVVDIASKTSISSQDYINASRLADQLYTKLGILSLGYEQTDSIEILEELDNKYPVKKIINHQEEYPNIYEVIFEKPLKDITWEDMYQIKYVNENIIDSTFIYSFSSPYSFEHEEDFAATCVTVPYKHTDKRDTYHGYYPLFGCEKLVTNVNIIPGDIIGKPLRQLTANIVSDSINKLDYFASLPHLEELMIRAKEMSADDLTGLYNLKKLSIQSWIFSDDNQLVKDPIALANLTSIPTLTELYLEDYELVDREQASQNEILTRLSLKNCVLTGTNSMSNFINLEDFSMDGCNLTTLDFIGTYPNLKNMYLLNNQKIDSISIDGPFQKLTTLAIDSNVPIEPFLPSVSISHLSIARAEDLPKLAGFTNLVSLQLLGTEQTYNLFQLPMLPNLNFLKVAPSGDYTQNKLWNLPLLNAFPNLNKLWLENLSDTDGFNQFIRSNQLVELALINMVFRFDPASFMNADRIRKLQINYIGLDGEEGQEFLQTIGNLSGITYLDLSNSNINDLSFLSNLQLLETFIANNNQIQDRSFLESLPSLNRIELNNNP